MQVKKNKLLFHLFCEQKISTSFPLNEKTKTKQIRKDLRNISKNNKVRHSKVVYL